MASAGYLGAAETRWDLGVTWLGGIALCQLWIHATTSPGPLCCCEGTAALFPVPNCTCSFGGSPASGWPWPRWVTPDAMGLQARSGHRRGGGRLPPSPGPASHLPHLAMGKPGGGRQQGCPSQPTHQGSLSPSCPAGWGAFRMGSTGLLHSLAPPAAAIGFGPFIVWRRGRSYSGAGRKYPGRRIHAWLFAESVSLWEGGREGGSGMPNLTSHPRKLFCLQPRGGKVQFCLCCCKASSQSWSLQLATKHGRERREF